ncbi:GtrA family protein [Devosia sp. 2618]|uniref:GtrA family protein n=1 Tax=Devosia sp. 2618 TaxID=3156454 RepID=UPI003392DD5E
MSLPPVASMQEAPTVARRMPDFGGLFAFIGIGGGAAAAFVVLSTVIISLNTGVADWIVNTGCYAAFIIPVYLLHRRLSFRSNAPHMQALPRYLAVQGMALILAAVFSFTLHGVMNIPALFSSMLVIALTSGVNFLVLRSWAFARAHWSEVTSS